MTAKQSHKFKFSSLVNRIRNPLGSHNKQDSNSPSSNTNSNIENSTDSSQNQYLSQLEHHLPSNEILVSSNTNSSQQNQNILSNQSPNQNASPVSTTSSINQRRSISPNTISSQRAQLPNRSSSPSRNSSQRLDSPSNRNSFRSNSPIERKTSPKRIQSSSNHNTSNSTIRSQTNVLQESNIEKEKLFIETGIQTTDLDNNYESSNKSFSHDEKISSQNKNSPSNRPGSAKYRRFEPINNNYSPGRNKKFENQETIQKQSYNPGRKSLNASGSNLNTRPSSALSRTTPKTPKTPKTPISPTRSPSLSVSKSRPSSAYINNRGQFYPIRRSFSPQSTQARVNLESIPEASPRVLELSKPLHHEYILNQECVFSPKTNTHKKSFKHIAPRYLDGVSPKPKEDAHENDNNEHDSQESNELNQENQLNTPKKSKKISERLIHLSQPILRKKVDGVDYHPECTFHPKITFYREDV